jgi:hypothetical protein
MSRIAQPRAPVADQSSDAAELICAELGSVWRANRRWT